MVPKWKPEKTFISKGLNWLSHKLDEAIAASWEDISGRGLKWYYRITLPCHENFHQPCQKNTKLDPCSLGTPHRTLQIWCLFSQCIVLPKWKPKNGTKMEAQKKIVSKASNWLSHKLDEAIAASWEDISGRGLKWYYRITLPCHENFHQPCQKNTKLDPCSLGTPHRTLQIWCLFSQCIVLPKWKPKNGTKMEAQKKIVSKASNWLSHKLDEAIAASWEDISGRGLKWYYRITLPCHENFHQPCQKNTKLDPCSLGTPHRTLQIWCLFSQCIVLPKWKPKNGTKMEAQKKIVSKASNWLSHKLDEAIAASWEDISGRGLKWYYRITLPCHENFHQPCQKNTKLDPCSLGTPHRTLPIWCLFSQCIVLPKWKPKKVPKRKPEKKTISKGLNWLSHKLDEAVGEPGPNPKLAPLRFLGILRFMVPGDPTVHGS